MRRTSYDTLDQAQAARVAELLADGLTIAWIADDLGVTFDRVKHHVRNNRHLAPLLKANGEAFGQVWSSIRFTPSLYQIHQELRPAKMST